MKEKDSFLTYRHHQADDQISKKELIQCTRLKCWRCDYWKSCWGRLFRAHDKVLMVDARIFYFWVPSVNSYVTASLKHAFGIFLSRIGMITLHEAHSPYDLGEICFKRHIFGGFWIQGVLRKNLSCVAFTAALSIINESTYIFRNSENCDKLLCWIFTGLCIMPFCIKYYLNISGC